MPNTKLYWLQTLSPTHAGIGRGVGYIDLPIERDGVTNWPIIRASGFKGVWRDWAVREGKEHIDQAFGKQDPHGESANSGAFMPTDAKLVCLPVRSFRGTFAWVTSPLCLQMLSRTLKLAGNTNLPEVRPIVGDSNCYCSGNALIEDKKVYLEDLDFTAIELEDTKNWAEFMAKSVFGNDTTWQDHFIKRFVIIPNDTFDFLCETGTEVHTRVRINQDTKTVKDGALWTEELLPAETILMGVIQCDRVFQKKDSPNPITEKTLLTDFASGELILQIGGKATVGRGQVRCVFSEVN